MRSPEVKVPVCLWLSQRFPDKFDFFFTLVTLVNILVDHMMGNIALSDYSRDNWSPTWYDVKDTVIISILVPILMYSNIG